MVKTDEQLVMDYHCSPLDIISFQSTAYASKFACLIVFFLFLVDILLYFAAKIVCRPLFYSLHSSSARDFMNLFPSIMCDRFVFFTTLPALDELFMAWGEPGWGGLSLVQQSGF